MTAQPVANDSGIAAGAQARCQDAARLEMIECLPRLRRYARSLERDATLADDLVQETLERALRKLHLYEPSGPLIAWLTTMMRRIAIDRGRQRSVHSVRSIHDLPFAIEPAREGDQLDRLMLRDLQHAIGKLPGSQREVLLLIGLAGLTYEQAAERLGVPVGTVRSRLFRARDTLMRRLEPHARRTVEAPAAQLAL